MKRIPLLLIALLSLVIVAGCGKSPATNANDLAATAYATIADARDAGLVTQAEIDRYKPIADRVNKALDLAGQAERNKDSQGKDNAIAAARQALAELKPLLDLINERRTVRRVPATTRPAAPGV